MKNRILVYFALCYLTMNRADTQKCSNGSVHLIEVAQIRGYNLGRISICSGGEWRAVCGAGWDISDARVLCRQLGYSIQMAQACGDSCFGRSILHRGATNFECVGNEDALSRCKHKAIEGPLEGRSLPCSQYAGAVCANITALQLPRQDPMQECSNCATCRMKCPLNDSSHSITQDSYAQIDTPPSSTTTCPPSDCTLRTTSGDSISTVALGVMSLLLLLILVGVVLGWVWFFFVTKTSRKSSSSINTHAHSSNDQTTPPQPSVIYSSLGPHDTPTSHTSPQGGEEGLYQVLEPPEREREEERVFYHILEQPGTEEERVYHVLEQEEREISKQEEENDVYCEVGEVQEERGQVTYEVPVLMKSKGGDEHAKREVEVAYSTLHHN